MTVMTEQSFKRRLIQVAVASCFAGVAHANPVGPTVINGTASFNAVGNAFNITNSSGAIINWQGFSIGAGEITRFIQKSAVDRSSTASSAPELELLGKLLSNGRVFLINPTGIMIGAGRDIDVAGFVASRLNISNDDFLAGTCASPTRPPGRPSTTARSPRARAARLSRRADGREQRHHPRPARRDRAGRRQERRDPRRRAPGLRVRSPPRRRSTSASSSPSPATSASSARWFATPGA